MKAEVPSKNLARKNVGASVRARLLNIARKDKRDYNALLVNFIQERFLYRLSLSAFSRQFILKGALLMRAYPLPNARPTKDIDFLGTGIRNEPGDLLDAIRSILQIEYNDGVEFQPESATIEQITEQAEYVGARANIKSSIGGARVSLQLDIGFGDVVFPGIQEMDYPVLLDFPSPHLRVYSLESAIAEKFESLVKLNLLTSRMKDIYDIIFIASHRSFRLKTLREAISSTFSRRNTSLDARRLIFDGNFAGNRDRQKQWSAFAKLQGGSAEQPLPEVVSLLSRFIEPPFAMRSEEANWHSQSWEWLTMSDDDIPKEGDET